jgi:APA family basic amino acid/polyamine antiporter
MFALPLDTWIRLVVWLIIGLILYFTYGKKKSKLEMVEKLEDKKEKLIIEN